MTYLIIFVLIVAWGFYFLSVFQARSQHNTGSSISTFSRQLRMLTPANRRSQSQDFQGTSRGYAGRPANDVVNNVSPALQATFAKQRRKNILVSLSITFGITLLLAIFLGEIFIFWSFFNLLLLGGYIALLRKRHIFAMQTNNVRVLQTAPTRQPYFNGEFGRDEYSNSLNVSSYR